MTIYLSADERILRREGNTGQLDTGVVRKLHGFAKLHAGWSFGRGLPISSDALAIAEDYLRLALQLQLTADVFPGLDGECAVRFYRGKDTVQVTINPDSTLDLRCERNDDDLIDPVVNAKSQDVYKHLLDFGRDETWNSSESSIFDNSTPDEGISSTWHSKIPASAQTKTLLTDSAEYRSWI